MASQEAELFKRLAERDAQVQAQEQQLRLFKADNERQAAQMAETAAHSAMEVARLQAALKVAEMKSKSHQANSHRFESQGGFSSESAVHRTPSTGSAQEKEVHAGAHARVAALTEEVTRLRAAALASEENVVRLTGVLERVQQSSATRLEAAKAETLQLQQQLQAEVALREADRQQRAELALELESARAQVPQLQQEMHTLLQRLQASEVAAKEAVASKENADRRAAGAEASLAELQETAIKLQSEGDAARAKIMEDGKGMSALQQQLLELRQEQAQAAQQLSQASDSHLKATEQLAAQLAQHTVVLEELEHLKAQKALVEANVASLSAEASLAREQADAIAMELATSRERAEQLQLELTKRCAQQATGSYDTAWQQELDRLRDEKASTDAALAGIAAELAEARQQADKTAMQLADERVQRAQELKAQEASAREMAQELECLRSQTATPDASLALLRDELATARSQAVTLAAEDQRHETMEEPEALRLQLAAQEVSLSSLREELAAAKDNGKAASDAAVSAMAAELAAAKEEAQAAKEEAASEARKAAELFHELEKQRVLEAARPRVDELEVEKFRAKDNSPLDASGEELQDLTERCRRLTEERDLLQKQLNDLAEVDESEMSLKNRLTLRELEFEQLQQEVFERKAAGDAETDSLQREVASLQAKLDEHSQREERQAERDQALASSEHALHVAERRLTLREQAVAEREEATAQIEEAQFNRSAELAARELTITEKEKEVQQKEKEVQAREGNLKSGQESEVEQLVDTVMKLTSALEKTNQDCEDLRQQTSALEEQKVSLQEKVNALERGHGDDEASGEELLTARKSLQEMTAKARRLESQLLAARGEATELRARVARDVPTNESEGAVKVLQAAQSRDLENGLTGLLSGLLQDVQSGNHAGVSLADLGLSEVAVLPRVDGFLRILSALMAMRADVRLVVFGLWVLCHSIYSLYLFYAHFVPSLL